MVERRVMTTEQLSQFRRLMLDVVTSEDEGVRSLLKQLLFTAAMVKDLDECGAVDPFERMESRLEGMVEANRRDMQRDIDSLIRDMRDTEHRMRRIEDALMRGGRGGFAYDDPNTKLLGL